MVPVPTFPKYRVCVHVCVFVCVLLAQVPLPLSLTTINYVTIE